VGSWHIFERSLTVFALAATAFGCGGRLVPSAPEDASPETSVDAGVESGDPCRALKGKSCYDARTTHWCSFVGHDHCALLGDAAPPAPVPESEILHLDAPTCMSLKDCNTDADCAGGGTCRYIVVSCEYGCILDELANCDYRHACVIE
jgi:hypothetical protein